MSSFLRFFKRILGTDSTKKVAEALGPDLSRFAEGDRILIANKRLTGPLTRNQRHDLRSGYLSHNTIIGAPAIISHLPSSKGEPVEVTYPSFDQYISLAPRKVTPVYSSYAALIVSILDIHVPAPTSRNEPSTIPPLEILESGTGHGALTLHLARAISAANPPPPSSSSSFETWSTWRTSRRAILHSVEISQSHNTHAEKLVRGFRQGLYWPHIDFYVNNVNDWVNTQLWERKKLETEFLSHVLLDLPGVHYALLKVVRVMKEEALLVVFVPSVTQIADCVRQVEAEKLPLVMEKVVEVGEGLSGGRTWDVRLAYPRQKKAEERVGPSPEAEGRETEFQEQEDRIEEQAISEPVMVARPKVGRLIVGGGFVGVWRKRMKQIGGE